MMNIRRFAITFTLFFGILFTSSLPQTAATENFDLSLNAEKTYHPISEYIYGQFIEHLGRCIYGGIWAEMLQDRKFYYPITDEFDPYRTVEDRGYFQGGKYQILDSSPWRVVGGVGIVEMRSANSFVGKHTPEISLSGGRASGIEQGDLAVENRKSYTGRVILSGEAEAAPIEVQLIWGDGADGRETFTVSELDNQYRTFPFVFTAKATTSDARLRIVGKGEGTFRIGTVSLMPADNVEGFRPDTLKLMKELDSPVYRWPGGNFVSDYNWKDGVGERDLRPPRKNPAWTGIEPNDVGIHEFIRLCELLDSEPFIAVNTGLGSVELAAGQVEYCNGSTETAMGAWRANNGHPNPFHVKWWAIGNEMYGDWQLGHMPLKDYVKKHNRVVEAIRKVDPNAKMIAVGSVGEWSRTMMQVCAGHMDLISEHLYWKNKEDLVEHVRQPVEGIRRVAEAHRQYRKELDSLQGKDIQIALDEWNYWYGRYIYGELGVQYHLQDALGIAAGLHEMFRNSDMYFMANYAQTVNVIGAIKTSKTDAVMETTGLILKMYRKHYGQIPIEIEGVPEPCDAVAAWTQDRKAITVAVVNPTETARTFNLNVDGADLFNQGDMWFITGNDRMVHNEPNEPMNVEIQHQKVSEINQGVSISPLSVSLIKVNVSE